jgi:SAM-dependent methyltransferase
MDANGLYDYFQVKQTLLPFLPDLLQDLWALGSSPDIIVEWIQDLDLHGSTVTVLDLGCGKGAVSIPLADRFGFRVEGIDLFEPFLDEARNRADSMGVGSLCTFRQADISETLASAKDFDLVVYSSIGFILGTVEQTIGILRDAARPGGYILLDDGCRTHQDPIPFPGYENYIPYDETIQQLTRYGDRILKEKRLSVEEMKAVNDWNTEHIRRQVDRLAAEHPDRSSLFYEYLESERKECEILETLFQGALWLIQKQPSDS